VAAVKRQLYCRFEHRQFVIGKKNVVVGGFFLVILEKSVIFAAEFKNVKNIK